MSTDLVKRKLANSKIPYIDRAILYLSHTYPIKIGDQKYRFNLEKTHSRHWYSRLIGTTHEKAVSHFISSKIEKEDYFMDIGSHVGYFSVIARTNTENKVVAVEMNPKLIEDIENQGKNLSLDDFKVINCALSNTQGKITSFGTDNIPASNSIAKKSSTYVITAKLETLIEEFRTPDLAKLDIEGAEAKVLPEYLSTNTPFNLVLEIHGNMMTQQELENLEEVLFENYQKVSNIQNQETEKGFELNEIKELRKSGNYTVYLEK